MISHRREELHTRIAHYAEPYKWLHSAFARAIVARRSDIGDAHLEYAENNARWDEVRPFIRSRVTLYKVNEALDCLFLCPSFTLVHFRRPIARLRQADKRIRLIQDVLTTR